jgi:hypothetical protein
MLQAFADTGAFNDKLESEGHLVFADGGGETPMFTGGPYLETKEYLGGLWVIEASDLDAALALATEGSRACRGKVEVRPFQASESLAALLEP